MNFNEFKKSHTRIVFTSNVITKSANHEKRRLINITEQLNLALDNSHANKLNREFDYNNLQNNSVISITKSRKDTAKQASDIKYYSSLIDCICLSLNQTFEEYNFEVVNNEKVDANNNPHSVLCSLQLVACSKLGNTLTDSHIEDVRESVRKIFSEINLLINQINKTISYSSIKSVILCKHNEHKQYTNPISYLDEGASLFVHKLFTPQKSRDMNLVINNCGEKIIIDSPKSPSHSITGVKPSEIIGSMTIKSSDAMSFMLTGNYTDKTKEKNTLFRGIIHVNQDDSENLFEDIKNVDPKSTFLVTVIPVQNYVCHAGISAKKYHLVSYKKN